MWEQMRRNVEEKCGKQLSEMFSNLWDTEIDSDTLSDYADEEYFLSDEDLEEYDLEEYSTFIPDEAIVNYWLDRIDEDPEYFFHMSRDCWIPVVMEKFIASNPTGLFRLTHKHMTPELAYVAIKQEPSLISRLPDHLITKEIIYEVYEYDVSLLFTLSLNKLQDSLNFFDSKKFWLEVAHHNVELLFQTPFTKWSRKLIKVLSKEFPSYIGKLPAEKKTIEIYQTIFDINYGTFPYIPDDYKTYQMCMFIICEKKYLYEKFIPYKYNLEDMYLHAIEVDWTLFKERPNKLQNSDFDTKAITINKDIIYNSSERLLLSDNKYLLRLAFCNGCHLKYFPDSIKTYQICLDAMLYKKAEIEDIPIDFREKILSNKQLQIAKFCTIFELFYEM